MKFKLCSSLAAGIAALSLLASPSAFAQSKYPERPIRLVVPFSPGGVMDIVGRNWAVRVKPSLGTVVVENQGGAGGTIGAAEVARSRPDGYTLLLGNTSTQIINPLVMKNVRYDPVKSFVPVSVIAISSNAIIVGAKLPVKTIKELIEYGKANPGKLSYGSAGTGTLTQLAGEMFKQITGLNDIVHVPYKGAGPGMSDLVSGHIPMMIANITGPVLQMNRAGRIRILAAAAHARLKGAPDIPIAIESGLPGMVAELFSALLAPAGTPPAIVEQIAEATRKALADENYQQALIKAGFELSADTTPDKALKF
ncbi:MAG: hypothetical protein A3G25_03540, partial [Betaproteobacteria bacterium RIFCSPLOWO2_12_FULL_63_13]